MGPKVEVYCDGSISKNPGGIGGYGALLVYRLGAQQAIVREVAGGEFDTTNNRMEMLAAIEGLKALTRKCKARVFSDSQYVVRGMNEYLPKWLKGGYLHEKANADLWKQLKHQADRHIQVEFIWVRGHNGHYWNELADALARQGRILTTESGKDGLHHNRRYEWKKDTSAKS